MIDRGTPAVDNTTVSLDGSGRIQIKDGGISLAKLAGAVKAFLFG